MSYSVIPTEKFKKQSKTLSGNTLPPVGICCAERDL